MIQTIISAIRSFQNTYVSEYFHRVYTAIHDVPDAGTKRWEFHDSSTGRAHTLQQYHGLHPDAARIRICVQRRTDEPISSGRNRAIKKAAISGCKSDIKKRVSCPLFSSTTNLPDFEWNLPP